jgi:hypothetical protein
VPFGEQVSDAQLQQLLQDFWQVTQMFPCPHLIGSYFWLLPPSVEVVMTEVIARQKPLRLPQKHLGNIFYAVMPFSCEGGCTGDYPSWRHSPLSGLMNCVKRFRRCSVGQGWYNDPKGEIGGYLCLETEAKSKHYTKFKPRMVKPAERLYSPAFTNQPV